MVDLKAFKEMARQLHTECEAHNDCTTCPYCGEQGCDAMLVHSSLPMEWYDFEWSGERSIFEPQSWEDAHDELFE